MTEVGHRQRRLRARHVSVFILAAVMLAGPCTGDAQRQTSTPSLIKASSSDIRDDERPLSVDTNLITLNVSVTDADGRAMSGLSKDVFTVFDDDEPQEITFFSGGDAPASVAVLFDTSASMSGRKIVQARGALARLIETSHQDDEFSLIDFDARARLLLDKTRDGDAVLNKLTYVRPRGNTSLYDAVYLGVEKAARGTHQKRALILISDGEDNSSRYSLGELRRKFRESGVTVYTVGISVSYLPKARGRSDLHDLASVTGGKSFFPDGPTGMYEAFERIALDLRRQYSISYRPSNFAADGKWHRLKIKLLSSPGSPRLLVRSRRGYYALAK